MSEDFFAICKEDATHLKITVEPNTKRCWVKGHLLAEHYSVFRNMPGRSKWADKQFVFEKTAANVEYVKSRIPDAEWVDEGAFLVELNALREMEKDSIAEKKSRIYAPPKDYVFKNKPYQHQIEALHHSRGKEAYAYIMEQGTGKTFTTINDLAWLALNRDLDTVLIIAPNGVHRQWANEQLPLHMPDAIKFDTWVFENKRKLPLRIQFRTPGRVRIVCMAIDAFSRDIGLLFARKYLSEGTSMVVLDESSRIKNQGSNRTKSVLKLRPLCDYRRILSGTPITQGVEDLYTQFSFLNPNIIGYSSFYSFRNRFCTLRQIPGAPTGVSQVVGYKNLDELHEKLEGHSFRVKKSDCLDLPEKIYMQRDVPLTPEQKKVYEEVRDNFFTEIKEGKIIDAALALTRLMKLQQILSGFIKDEESQLTEIPSHRAESCLGAIEEAQGKVIVWARFHYDIDSLSKLLDKAKIAYRIYDGRQSSSQRTEALSDFQNNPEVRVFLMNQRSGGIGLNLIQATTQIFYTNSFSAEDRWQAEDRSHRIGQKEHVVYIDMVSHGTVDVKIARALRSKKNIADMVLEPEMLISDLELSNTQD